MGHLPVVTDGHPFEVVLSLGPARGGRKAVLKRTSLIPKLCQHDRTTSQAFLVSHKDLMSSYMVKFPPSLPSPIFWLLCFIYWKQQGEGTRPAE